MPCNQRFARNSSTSDRVEEAMRRPKVEEGYDNDRMGDELGTYPDRPGEPDCLYYLRTGSCGYGSNCRLNHPSNAAAGQVYGLETNSEHPERAGQPNCGLLARQKSSREPTQSKSLLLTVVTHFGNIREKTEQPIERCCTVV